MAQHIALVKCFIDNTLRREGDTFEYDGPPNHNLKRVGGRPDSDDDAAPAKKWVPRAKREKASME